MEDLTRYSDEELTLRVMNEEYLYRMRFSSYLKDSLESLFEFTHEQWEDLQETLEQDLQEQRK